MQELNKQLTELNETISQIHTDITATYGDTRKADLIATLLYKHSDAIRNAAMRDDLKSQIEPGKLTRASWLWQELQRKREALSELSYGDDGIDNEIERNKIRADILAIEARLDYYLQER